MSKQTQPAYVLCDKGPNNTHFIACWESIAAYRRRDTPYAWQIRKRDEPLDLDVSGHRRFGLTYQGGITVYRLIRYEEMTPKQKQAADQRKLDEENRRRSVTPNFSFFHVGLFSDCLDRQALKSRYRSLCLKMHPDKGGDPEQFKEMQADFEQAQGRLFC